MRGEMKDKAQEKQGRQDLSPWHYTLYVKAVGLFTNQPKPGPVHSSKVAARIDL